MSTSLNCPHALKFNYRGSFYIISAPARGTMKNLGSGRRVSGESEKKTDSVT
jgi:hypothetical protein